MQLTTFTTGAAVLLALVSSVFAGTARVVNNCGSSVYYANVPHGGSSNMQLLPAGGYSTSMSDSSKGVAIKLSSSKTGAVTQLEYTMTGNKLAYDMSNIDGNPFASGGMLLTPSMQGDSSNPTCIPVECPAGQASCDAAYNQPDDVRTLVCNSATDLTLTLCPGGAKLKRDDEESIAQPQRAHARDFLKLLKKLA